MDDEKKRAFRTKRFIVFAGIIILLFRHYWVADHLHNGMTLLLVVAAFALSNVLRPEAGLLTVTIMMPTPTPTFGIGNSEFGIDLHLLDMLREKAGGISDFKIPDSRKQ